MRIPVLTFHAWRYGEGFAENDHFALDETLRILTEQKIAVVPLARVVAALRNPLVRWRLPGRAIALSSDDGDISEVEDGLDEAGNPLRSFSTILASYEAAQRSLGGVPHMTSFVIASAAARAQINPQHRLADHWWQAAAASKQFSIGAHSWDHCHPDVSEIAQREQRKGTFAGVDNFADADRQIRQANAEINRKISPQRTSLFAYPYGDSNDYLAKEYFPHHQSEHRMDAAFTTEPTPVERGQSRWLLPRYVYGSAYKSADDLHALLRDIY